MHSPTVKLDRTYDTFDTYVQTIYSFIIGTHKPTPLKKEKQPTTMKETPAACSPGSAPLTPIVSLFYSISVHYYKYNLIIMIIYKQDHFLFLWDSLLLMAPGNEKNITTKFEMRNSAA